MVQSQLKKRRFYLSALQLMCCLWLASSFSSCHASVQDTSTNKVHMLVHNQNFAQELLIRELITPENHSQLLKDLEEMPDFSLLDFLPYCQYATVIDLQKIKESTATESELVGEIVKQIASIHPNLAISNFEGSFGEYDGYIHHDGFSFEHNKEIYQDFAETADELPLVFNRMLEADASDYRVVVLYDYFSPQGTVDLNKDYRKFGVILMQEAQLENLFYYSPETKIFGALPFPALQEVYGKENYSTDCITWAVPPGKSFTNLKEALKHPEQVENLYLNSEGLTILGPEIKAFINLRTLSLANNMLTTLPPEIGLLTELRKIDLQENKITHLPPEILKLEQLEELDLSMNFMEQLPLEVCALKNLRFLYLEYNNLVSLPNEIGTLTQLCQLNVGKNNLAYLPNEFGQLQNLSYLNLSKNKLEYLPLEFHQLTKLLQLVLSDNKLRALDEGFGQLKRLEFLTLDDNKLEALPDEFCELTNLTQLSLDKNKLGSLPLCLEELTQLQYFSFKSENAFSDEELTNIQTWFAKQEERLYWCRILVED